MHPTNRNPETERKAQERLIKRHPVVNMDKSSWPEPEPRKALSDYETEKCGNIERKIRKDLVGKVFTVSKGYKNPIVSVVQEIMYYPWEAKWGDARLGILIGGEWVYVMMEKYWDIRTFKKIKID